MRCSGLCPRRPRGGSGFFGCSRVETRDMWMLPRDVTEKALLSSAGVEFVVLCVMPSILRIRLDGWFSRCRGQSSGKSTSRQRSYERYSRDVQEPIDVHAKRAICDSRVVFNSLTCPCPRAACRIRLSVWGGAPPMSRLAGVDQKFCDISCTFGIDKLTDLYTCIYYAGVLKFNGHQHSLSHPRLAFFRDQTLHFKTHITVYAV